MFESCGSCRGSRFFLDAGVFVNGAASEGITPFHSALVERVPPGLTCRLAIT